MCGLKTKQKKDISLRWLREIRKGENIPEISAKKIETKTTINVALYQVAFCKFCNFLNTILLFKNTNIKSIHKKQIKNMDFLQCDENNL